MEFYRLLTFDAIPPKGISPVLSWEGIAVVARFGILAWRIRKAGGPREFGEVGTCGVSQQMWRLPLQAGENVHMP